MPHRRGRPVELIRAGRLDGAPWCVLITARHHACEAMAGYALEGLLAAILAADGDGPWFRERVEVLAIPFVDKDGVEDGDQGKNRKPHDHGRDYIDQPIHPETAALMARVPAWLAGRPLVAIDIHCPGLSGTLNQHVYQVGAREPEVAQEQGRFGTLLESLCSGPIRYRAASDVAFGTAWNTAANLTVGQVRLRGLRGWASTLPGCRLATSLEIPYADAGGIACTPESVRHLGHDLAKALHRYIGESP